MTSTAADPYRVALEAEGGEPVSAGARAVHPPAVVTFDLSFVPAARRASVVADIHERIAREVRDAEPVA
ncbi:MAG: hypothetical protein K2X82_12500 [Gemmataceae bacterium]|nr:hypothetical protein [Gemmataceae bacterium]